MTEKTKRRCLVVEDEAPCERAHYARDMCATHYERWRRHGDPLVTLKTQSPRGESKKGCSFVEVDGSECGKSRVGRGYCRTHYMRVRRNGSPDIVKKPGRVPTLASDRSLIDKDALDGCWGWTGYKNAKGYGVVSVGGRMRLAHRAIYEELVGPVPKGMQLDHLCANEWCVNPEHMEPVTGAENHFRGGRPHFELRGTVKGAKVVQVMIGTKTL